MADIEQLIKDGLIGATIGAVADITLHGGVPVETAAAIGATAGGIISELKAKDKEPKSRNYSKRREYPDTTNNELIRFNARHNSQSNSSYGNAEGGGFNRIHVFHHDGDKENEPHPPFPQGDGRENFAFTEASNYAENIGYEPFEQEPDVDKELQNVTNNHKELQNVTKYSNAPPLEVQASILKWQGKSPSKTCQKHEVEMPANACYSCGSGGGMCEHHALFDGTKKIPHCVYPQTRQEVALASKRIGKPVKTHRNINRTHLTGIETGHLLALADDTLVDDKDSLRQELEDHIDSTLSYAENKTALQDYLASVTPLNTDVTDREIKEYEERINTIAPEEIEQANDPFLIESLKERAANGDSSASMQLELMDIKRDGFAQMGVSAPLIADEPPIDMSVIAPAPIMEAPPIMETQDPAMSWCSSTPETLEFSRTFEPPPPKIVNDSCLSSPQATASPELRNEWII